MPTLHAPLRESDCAACTYPRAAGNTEVPSAPRATAWRSATELYPPAAFAALCKRAQPIKLYWRVDIERIISEIESLEEMYDRPDIRPLNAADILAANQRHDRKQAHSPWFRLWQRYGVCCRSEAPVLRLGEIES